MKNKLNTSLSLRKLMLSALVAAPLATLPSSLWALPSTLPTNVTASNGSLTTITPNGTNIQVIAPDRTVLRWGVFGATPNASLAGTVDGTFKSGESITFTLPSSTSAILNTVSTGSTTIEGAVSSNGSVLFLNANGIAVSGSARFDTAGLTLSTLNETEFGFQTTGQLSLTQQTPSTGITFSGNPTVNVGKTGNVFLAGKDVAVSGTVTAGTLTVLARGGVAQLGYNGNLTLGAIGSKDPIFGTVTPGYGTATVTAKSVEFGSAAGNTSVSVLGGTLSVTSDTTITQNGSGALTLGDKQSNPTLTLKAGSSSAINLSSLNGNSKEIKATITGGATTIAGISGDFTLQPSTINGNLSLSSSGAIKSGGETVVSSGSSISLSTSGAAGAEFKGPGDLVFATLSSSGGTKGTFTLTSTTGSVTLGNVNSQGAVTVTAAADIKQSAAAAAPGLTVDAKGGVLLENVANNIASFTVNNAPGGVKFVDAAAGGLTLTGGSATGAVEISNAGPIILGSADSDAVLFSSSLKLTTTGAGNGITDKSNAITILGALTMDSAGNIVLNGSSGNGLNLKNTFGAVTAKAPSIAIFEATTLNLAGINATTGDLMVYSAAGDIVNTGQLKVAGTTTVGAGTSAAPGNVSLNFSAGTGSGNQLAGNILVIDDYGLLAAKDGTLPVTNGAITGNYLVKNLTIVNEGVTNIGPIVNLYGAGIVGDLNVTAVNSSTTIGSITMGSQVNVTGKATLTASGDITATQNNGISNFTVVSGGNVNVKSASDVVFNATLTQAAAGKSATFVSDNTLTIGQFVSDYSGTITFDTKSSPTTNKKDIKDSVAGISIYGTTVLNSGKGISITKSGHNFGGVSLTTTDGAATFVESGTLRLIGASTGKGNLTLTSSNGSVFQDAASTGILSTGKGTFSAATDVKLDDPTAKNTISNVSITAGGNAVVNVQANLTLGNITTGGTFSADVSTKADAYIIQASGTKMNTYGLTIFKTNGSTTADRTKGSITVTNTGNRFGGLVLSSGNGNIAITEATTMNLKSVLTTGSFTAASEGGSIIDSVDSTLPAGFANSISVSNATNNAAVSLSATKGDIIISGSNNNFEVLSLNAGGNASVLDSAGNLTLDTSVIGGTLDITSTAAASTIGQLGAINAAGNTTFMAATGALALNNTANQFGGLRFVVQNESSIVEATTMNLRGNSIASNNVVLTTGGDFLATGSGSTFVGNLTVQATGTIKPSAGSIIVLGNLTVYSNTAKDLSALSKQGNLSNKEPINLGSGTYTGPGL